MARYFIYKIHLFSVLFFLTGIFLHVKSQPFWPTDQGRYEEALGYMLADEYIEAVPLLKTLQQNGFDNANIKYRLGECYLNIPGQKWNALPYFEAASKNIIREYKANSVKETNAPLKSLLLLGIAYRLQNYYEEAIMVFNQLKDSLANEQKSQLILDMHIQQCENAKEMVAYPSDIIKKNLSSPINNSYNNYSPVLTPDEEHIYYMTELKFYDAVMHSTKTFNKLWDIPENMTPIIKSDGDFYIMDVSSDGNRLLLYSYEPYFQGELYMTEKKNDDWEPLTKLNENINTRFHETSGSFSPNGKVLYFTSTREGSLGGTDIFKSEMDATGDWGPAIPLSSDINTVFDEETPFVSSDGTKLFFSSKGHHNIGGFDIFYSALGDNNTWLPPVNLGYPLNTTDNDVFYYPIGDGFTGYSARYSNNRNGISDIFRYQIMAVSNPPNFKILGEIICDSAYIDKTTSIAIRNEKKDTLKEIKTDANGIFSFKVPAGIYDISFLHHELPVNEMVLDIPLYRTEKEIHLYPELYAIVEEKAVPEEVDSISFPEETPQHDTIILVHILFDFDNYSISKKDKAYLSALGEKLCLYPEAMITITGHTDAIGNEQYNIYLSEKRAKSVADYLIQQKVYPDKIIVKGLGESEPTAPNSKPDGSDNPAGRKLNRRVEISIQEEYEELIILNKYGSTTF